MCECSEMSHPVPGEYQAVFENTYFMFFSDLKKRDFTFFEMTFQKKEKNQKVSSFC